MVEVAKKIQATVNISLIIPLRIPNTFQSSMFRVASVLHSLSIRKMMQVRTRRGAPVAGAGYSPGSQLESDPEVTISDELK